MLSQEQKDYILEHYDHTRYGIIKQIADSLGLKPTTVLYNLRQMGIHRHRNGQPNIPTCNMPEYRRVYYRVYNQAVRIIKRGDKLPYPPSHYAIQAVNDYASGLPVKHIDVQKEPFLDESHQKNKSKKMFEVPVVTVKRRRIYADRPLQHDKTPRRGILVGDYVPGTPPKGLYQRMLAECFT